MVFVNHVVRPWITPLSGVAMRSPIAIAVALVPISLAWPRFAVFRALRITG
jgi:hypothetical protein